MQGEEAEEEEEEGSSQLSLSLSLRGGGWKWWNYSMLQGTFSEGFDSGSESNCTRFHAPSTNRSTEVWSGAGPVLGPSAGWMGDGGMLCTASR